MANAMRVRIAQRGIITLPKALRESYDLKAGESLTFLDLGGVFVLSPAAQEADRLADRIARALAEKGESLETMLQAVREERERYGRKA